MSPPTARSRPAGGGSEDARLPGGSSTSTVAVPGGNGAHQLAPAVYRPSTVRRRRTRAQLAEVDAAILTVLVDEHPATLRGVFYRVVSAGAVEKSEAGYRLVGRQVLALRRSGRLPYSWITDGTRWIVKPRSYVDVEDMLADAASSYRRMLWHSQPVDVHIFTEKDAISGVISEVTERWDVPLGVLRGYCSETFAHSVAESVKATGKPVFVYQLGDHDPSGVDAWRDFTDKVRRFAPEAEVSFTRIAVTAEQIEELGLPTRPTKRTDTRARSFSGGSVEVDAIPPSTLRTLVAEAIEQHLDSQVLRTTRMVEQSERAWLSDLVAGATS